MPKRKEHIANEVALEVAGIAEAVAEKIEEEVGYYMGAEEVSNREVRGMIRRALTQGDEQAMLQVLELAAEQPTSPNPVIEQVAIVMDEMEG